MGFILNKLNLKYDIFLTDSLVRFTSAVVKTTIAQEYGILTGNGTEFDGYIGAVQRGELDTFAADFIPSAQRIPYFEFSMPSFNTETVVVSSMWRNETLAASIFDMARTFSADLWALIACIMLILFCAQYFGTRIVWHVSRVRREVLRGQQGIVVADGGGVRRPTCTIIILFVAGALFIVLFQVALVASTAP